MSRYQAHQLAPEPRWRWLLGMASEILLVALFVVLVVGLAALQPMVGQ